jgi:hypothetical protein
MGFEGAKSKAAPLVGVHEVVGSNEVVEVTTVDVQQWRDDELSRFNAEARFGQAVVRQDLHLLAEERQARGYGPQSW